MSRRAQKCEACGAIGTIIEDTSRGCMVCTSCGSIIQQSVLINEVDFTELSNGTTSRNGQFVASASQKSNSFISTQSSIEGKARIQSICDQLPRLANQPDVCELAERIFKKALHERFIRGRTIEIVAAACVYVAIRQKRSTGYLLVDVADHVNCGIFELAATALRLSTCVNELMPVIDPTLYIDRFADELKFGRLSSDIKETAIKVIRRLDRDWIQTGRKPAGVCGAAIMIAARIHKVDLTKETILKCARVCNATITKRLNEISRTNLAKSSINELRENQDLLQEETHELPPAMLINKKLNEISEKLKAPKKEELLDGNFDDEELDDVDDLILSTEEAEKRSALFYTMYKSKLNQPPKEPKPRRNKKKEQLIDEDKFDQKEKSFEIEEGEEVYHDDDVLQSDPGEIDDFY
ncbi:transcription factor IIIB 90 kDa subunit-like [Histomonas meleagridis]|uniref:transcription factor IIIB 90 kDa subunit-like n=1 Tax=Histomonas meleagridis TaxID=135588 RepID=UPI00355A1A38|nr:transcription factor IIIB 90 kDa subunit-like [Histomonas meleagridis]KAH0802267.1 transcription factor IIIB 90 kDa subunit-like [Histomonas meleagridis]